jgi:hypothetical protein
MARSDLAFPHIGAGSVRQLQQAERIRDVHAALADAAGQAFLRPAEPAHQRLIGFRLFDRVQVCALNVLDDADLQQLQLVEVPHDGRNGFEAGQPGRAPAAFTGDDLILARFLGVRPDKDRLQDTPLLRIDSAKFLQRRIIERPARLGRIAADAP